MEKEVQKHQLIFKVINSKIYKTHTWTYRQTTMTFTTTSNNFENIKKSSSFNHLNDLTL